MKENLYKKLEQINTYLILNYQKSQGIGALTGISGIALFHFHYSRLVKNKEIENHAFELIKQCVDEINKGFESLLFPNGIAGFGWVLDQLEDDNFTVSPCDNLLADLDQIIFNDTISNFQKGEYDFLSGAIGQTLYFVKRYNNTKSKMLKKRYESYLESIIFHLKSGYENGKNYPWESIIDKDTNQKGCNLSISHGVSGIIIIITKLNKIKKFEGRLNLIIKNSINFLIQQQKENKLVSIFPNFITNKLETDGISRLGWCYGDLGVLMAIWYGSKSIKASNEMFFAKEMLLQSCTRRTDEETLIVDSGLCHGAFGVAQIYLRMAKEMNLDKLNAVAEFWIDQGMKMSSEIDLNNGGFLQWHGKEQGWVNKINLLEGTAGIGLTIIDLLTKQKSNWDQCLLIN